MAGLFEGLLGGGSDPYELYGDLLNDTQKAALRDQQTTRGLLQAAAIFSKAGQASRLPVSIPWGEAAAAFGGGQDEALKGIATAAQIRELQSKAKIRDQMFGPEANAKMDALLKAFGMGGGSTGAPAAAPTTPPAGAYIPDQAKSTLPMVNPALGPVELDAGGTPAAGLPTIPLDAPIGQQGGLLSPPDQVAGLAGPGVLARIAAMQQGGGGGSPAPFGGDPASSLRLASHINYGGTGALGNPAEAGWRSSNIVPVPAPGGASFNVHRAAAPDFAGFLQDLSALGYKIDPKTSGGYNYRNIRGSNSLSEHAYGTAIDINSNANLYTRDGRKVTDLPPEVGALAAKHNLEWGGNWKDPVDTMHFQWRGPGGEAAATATPGGQDQVIPSGRGVSPDMLRTVADTGGGVPGMPPVPVPPGVNPAAMNGLLIELARRNAAAEALGMGNPYGSMLSVLQGSPQYKAAIESATRGAGLPFVRREAEEKAAGTFPFEGELKRYQAELDRANKEAEMLGAARYDPAEIRVSDGKGGFATVQGTRDQKTRAARGLPVPELGITGIFRPGIGGPPPAGTLAPKPELTPGQETEQRGAAEARTKLVDDYSKQADLSADAKTTLQGISAEIGNMVHGPFAPAAQLASSYLRILNPGFNKQVSSYEQLYSNANELVRKAVRQSDPNPSFIQTQMAMDAMPVPERSPEGLAKITNRMIGVNDHNIARAAAIPHYQANIGNGSVAGFDSWWRKQVSPYAFVFSKMSPDDQVALVSRLNTTGQGQREVEKLKTQLGFIKQYGLEQ